MKKVPCTFNSLRPPLIHHGAILKESYPTELTHKMAELCQCSPAEPVDYVIMFSLMVKHKKEDC